MYDHPGTMKVFIWKVVTETLGKRKEKMKI
jgi:hypothetical protein